MKVFTFSTCILWFLGCAWAFDVKSGAIEGMDKPLKPVTIEKKCYPDIGCFSNGAPFYDPVHRPTSVVPEDCKDVQFYLYTPTRPRKNVTLTMDPASLHASTFDPKLPTMVTIGGYLLSPFNLRRQVNFKNFVYKSGKYNFIILDQRKYMKPPYYQAIANARTCGARLANLINFIVKETGASPASFHLVGYILGAQIAGYAGKRVKKLGRISAFDPAGFGFENLTDEVRLTYNDARFVDAIHTNEGKNFTAGFGTLSAIGHSDFYPVGGLLPDGCEEDEKLQEGDDLLEVGQHYNSVCQTDRAILYFEESMIRSKCHFTAVSCGSREDFEEGRCKPEGKNHVVAEMGLHAKKLRGVQPMTKFYLRINDAPPYCVPKGHLSA